MNSCLEIQMHHAFPSVLLDWKYSDNHYPDISFHSGNFTRKFQVCVYVALKFDVVGLKTTSACSTIPPQALFSTRISGHTYRCGSALWTVF